MYSTFLSSSFLFIRRLGEPFPFRGRQTLCKYYENNEILNEQLREIKSAQTVKEFEKLFRVQSRHNQEYPKSAKSVEPYFDVKAVLAPLKSFTSETCLCTKDVYRLKGNRVGSEHRSPTPVTPTFALNTSKGLDDKASSLDDFVHLASECYDKCINAYLSNLDDCNRRADIIERQSIRSSTGFSGRRTLKAKKINDLSLANRINKLCINLEAYHRDIVDPFQSTRQSTSSIHNCSHQTMSCNDTNNNNTESTNQLKDPPKIILSDHSTNQTLQADKSRDFSDNGSAVDKNCLSIPIENYYTSEARPP